MYYVKKTLEVSAAHRLILDYESKYTNLHGHNWAIPVYRNDFTHIKDLIMGTLDHKVINDVLPFNPTAENIAKWVVDSIPECYRADVQESENNIASYED